MKKKYVVGGSGLVRPRTRWSAFLHTGARMFVFLSVASFGLSVFADNVGTFDAATGTLTYEVAANTTNVENKAFSTYGTVTKVVKSGAGMLTIADGDNSTYAGTVEIVNGCFNIATANLFGTTESKIYVRSSADGSGQLRVSFKSGGQNSKHVNSNIYIAGSGPDGKGAIYAANTGMGDTSLAGAVILNADATVGGGSRTGFWLWLQGHTLTDTVTTEHLIRGVTKGEGHIIYSGGSRCVVNGNLAGTKDNTLTVAKAGASICFWNVDAAPAWTLKVNENASISGGNGNATTKNRWGGPVVIAKDKTLTLASYTSPAEGISVGVTGPISGEGKVVCNSYSGLNAYLTGENTYTGGTKVQTGILWANANKSIPETGSISVTGGRLYFNVDSGNWTGAEVRKRLALVTAASGTVNLYSSAGKTATDDGEGFEAGVAGGYFGHAGNGTYVTTGDITGSPTLHSIGAGLWRIQSKSATIKNFYLNTGKIALEDAGYIWTAKNDSSVCGSSTTIAHLLLNNTAVGGSETTGGTSEPNWGAKMQIGCSTGYRGVVEVTGEKAALTNYLWMGHNAGSAGAVWQDGGSVRQSCTSTADGTWGYLGYSGYDITGGTLHIGHCHNLGRSTGGVGILRIAGENALVKISSGNDLFIGSGGTGVVYQSSGTLTCSGTFRLGQRQWATATNGGHSEYTLSGGTATIKDLCLGQRPAPAYSVLNVNGGQLILGKKLYRWSSSGSEVFFTSATQPAAYVNFNGGTIGTSADITLFSNDGLEPPTKVTVYEGGIGIDVSKANTSVKRSLQAPTGLGVVAIALPKNCPTTGWIGPQHVVIRGGSGYGATAITDFDRKTMSISKIIITSPGQGYQEGDVVTATIPNVANSAPLTCASVQLGAIPSGGLTLKSTVPEKTCSLYAVNTYTGATVVAGGTLKIEVEGAIASSKSVRVASEATLDLNSKGSVTVDAFGGAGEVKNGGVWVKKELVFDAGDLTSSKALTVAGKLTLDEGVKVRIANAASGLPSRSRTILTAAGGIAGSVVKKVEIESAPGGYEWTAYVRGNSIRLACGKGLCLLVR